MILDGSWHFVKQRKISEAGANTGQPGNFDYVINADAANYVIYADDIPVVRTIEHDTNKIHTLRFRVVSPQRFIRTITLAGSFRSLDQSTFARSQDQVVKIKDTLARQALEKYQELFFSIDQGFAIIELLYDDQHRPNDFYIDQTNPALERITGLRNITGKKISQLLPEPPDDWFVTFGKIVQLRVPKRFTVRPKELGNAWYDIHAFPAGETNSNKLGILFTDITERVLAEEKLRDRQLKLSMAQREARVGFWTYNPAQGQGIATKEWMELMGYPDSPETWSLERFLSLVHEKDAPALRKAFQLATSSPCMEVEFRIQHPTRGLQWFLARGTYIPSGDAANSAIMGSIIDITDRKNFEEQKDQFIGIASHELKTPVTSIKAYAEILRDMFKNEADSTQSDMMERIINQVDRLTRLINDLLDTTRISGGRMMLEPETFDINKLIHDRVEEMQRTTSHRLVVKTNQVPPVFADKDRIGQVLTNLIANALKYSKMQADVIVSTGSTQQHVVVKVRDYGIGLSQEAQKRIFDRFYRVSDPRLTTVPGLGLGLFIASEIIRMHQGTMGVKSKEGQGSEFFFTLPYHQSSNR